ncbi:MAG: ATP-dependent DNA helicase RecQ [Flavobacteriales bacterium]|nr:ATP-dependent DNA helicase RecQ [Flavobacteriales bacterium]
MPSKPIPTAHQDIHAVLERVWGYTQFRPKQEEIIRSVLAGKDTMALLPTGGGKSICFQVPALAMGRMCLVISPLIALMKDQVSRLKKQGVAARAIVSSMRPEEIDNALESAALGKYAFLYVSPERLASELFKARLPRLPLGLIAVDEAHCISQWGYDFRPAYLNIAEVRIVRPDVPVIALTASATPQVAADIMQRLAFAKPTLIRGSFYRPELTLWLSRSEDKQGRLLRIFHHVPGTAIVYVRDRRSTIRIANFLSQHGISAAGYHAGLPPEERDRIQQEWTSGQVRCIVATNAFGMGIDKADVRAVVHMEPPADLESYYQEAGRAGRDGRSSYAFLLTGPGDVERMEERLLASFPALEHVRKVYQAFANLHGIALGSGLLQAYAVELQELVTRTKLPPLTITHSLKALEWTVNSAYPMGSVRHRAC